MLEIEKQTIYEVMGLNEIEDPVTDLNVKVMGLPSQMEKQTIYEVMGLNEIEDPVTDLNVFVPFQQVRVRLKKYTSKAQAKCCYFVQINHRFTVISSCTDAFVFFVDLRCNNSFLRLVRFVYCLPRMKFCFRIQEAVAVVGTAGVYLV